MSAKIFLFLLLLSSPVLATKLVVDFSYKSSANESYINTTLITKDGEWFQIGRQKSTTRNILLLGRSKSVNSKETRTEFLLIDNTRPNPIVSSPQLISKYNEKSEISINLLKEEIKISVLAKAQ